MTIDCWIDVDGERFADTAADYHAGTPTALADVEVAWGRTTTVDQPEAATARVTVLDQSGGTGFVDAIPVGVPIDVWASGDIGTGAATDVAVDGGFETPGLVATDRVRVNQTDSSTATTVTDRVHSGAQAIRIGTGIMGVAGSLIPPDVWTIGGSPASWDAIPKLVAGANWSWSVWVWAGRGVRVYARPYGMTGPTDPVGTGFGVHKISTGAGGWVQMSGTDVIPVPMADRWLGIQVVVDQPDTWEQTAGTWAGTPGTWADYGTDHWIDDQRLMAPPAATRDVLVFSGRVTDLSASVDVDGTIRVDVTAVDQLADLQNRYVGDQPWTMETLTARVARIISLSGADVDTRIDTALASLQVSRRDVDNQPAAGLLAELAAGTDGVLWSATHATTGPYLWIEDVARRAILATLALQGGVVVIVVDPGTNRPAGRTVLDGATLPQGEVSWVRDGTDVVTRVDATWLDQSTTPEPTERSVRVVDAPAEADGAVFRMGVSTPLTTSAAATNVGNRILARTRTSSWRTEGLTLDAGLTPPEPGADTAEVLDLLDGTLRIGRGLVVTNVERWPGGSTAAYLDGGRYGYDGAWVLQFATTPWTGVAESGPWRSLDPAWRWNQFDPAIDWADLYGVTGPIP